LIIFIISLISCILTGQRASAPYGTHTTVKLSKETRLHGTRHTCGILSA